MFEDETAGEDEIAGEKPEVEEAGGPLPEAYLLTT
jgi:hypothetical protein